MRSAWADLRGLWRRFGPFGSKRWWWLGAFAIILIVIVIVALANEGSNTDWSGMVTIATYGEGEQVRVKKGLLYFVGFLLWIFVMNLGDRGTTTCNYPKGGRI
jgi:hypothetical protein